MLEQYRRHVNIRKRQLVPVDDTSTSAATGRTARTTASTVPTAASSTPVVASPAPATSRTRDTTPVESSDPPVDTVTSTVRSIVPVASSDTVVSSTLPLSVPVVLPSSSTSHSTSYITNVVTVGPSSSISVTAEASNSGGDGPGAGAVVGIVAGALVGIVVIAGLIGYFFKSKFGKDEDEIDDNVFSKGDFRRESVMLPDDDAMSMRSGSHAGTYSAAGIGRANTALPGLARGDTGRPRPPSTLERHYLNASPIPGSYAPTPSFHPGQIINTGFYNNGAAPPQASYAPSDGGWGVAASYAQPSGHLQANYSDLQRNASVASAYPPEQGNSYYDQQHYNDSYPPTKGHTRTGTPEQVNPQQYYRDSADSQHQQTFQNNGLRAGQRGQRTLSIRNNNGYDDAYSGI